MHPQSTRDTLSAQQHKAQEANKKAGRGLMTFLQRDAGTGDREMKRCSVLLITREVQVKATKGWLSAPARPEHKPHGHQGKAVVLFQKTRPKLTYAQRPTARSAQSIHSAPPRLPAVPFRASPSAHKRRNARRRHSPFTGMGLALRRKKALAGAVTHACHSSYSQG